MKFFSHNILGTLMKNLTENNLNKILIITIQEKLLNVTNFKILHEISNLLDVVEARVLYSV